MKRHLPFSPLNIASTAVLISSLSLGGCSCKSDQGIISTPPRMRFPVNAALEDKIVYLGMDVSPAVIRAGDPFKLIHYWKVIAPVKGWHVFVHRSEPEGARFKSLDHTPVQGTLPVEKWKAGQVIRDEHSLTLPADWSGKVAIFTGLFQKDRRMKVKGPQDSNNRIQAAVLDVQPSMLLSMRAKYGPKQYSQDDEETLIRHFFKDRQQGFFVDVGSSFWKKYSTTYYLEHHLKWEGIAIDANPDYAPDYEKHRPRTTFMSYFISDTSDKIVDFFVLPSDAPLGSEKKAHLMKFRHVQLVKEQIKNRKVHTITLDKVLTLQDVKKVDFLSMDIEGAEMKALNGFNIKRFKPDLVCIETDHTPEDKLLAYFNDAGYKRIDEYLPLDSHNWYFARK